MLIHIVQWYFQDHQVIIKQNDKLKLLHDSKLKKKALREFKDKGFETTKTYNYIAGGNTYIGQYPNGEKFNNYAILRNISYDTGILSCTYPTLIVLLESIK